MIQIRNDMTRWNKRDGFTLIEMSIVLVIIGLLVGSVLVGKDMIRAAQNRGLISERERILTSVNTFRLKYNNLPGDLPTAEAFWGTDPGGCPNTGYNTVKKTTTCNGNGNGVIEGIFTPSTCVYPNTGPNREHHRFWQHLANAGLLDVSVTGATGAGNYYAQTIDINAPRSTYSSDVGISAGGHWNCTLVRSDYFQSHYEFVFFVGRQYVGSVTETPFLPPLDAFSVDTKVDDGKPGIGRVMVQVSPNCTDASTPLTAMYMMTQTDQNCVLLYSERL